MEVQLGMRLNRYRVLLVPLAVLGLAAVVLLSAERGVVAQGDLASVASQQPTPVPAPFPTGSMGPGEMMGPGGEPARPAARAPGRPVPSSPRVLAG